MQTLMLNTRKRSRTVVKGDDYRKSGIIIRRMPITTMATSARRRYVKIDSRTIPLYDERLLPT